MVAAALVASLAVGASAVLIPGRAAVALVCLLFAAALLRVLSWRGYPPYSAPAIASAFFVGYGVLGFLISPSFSATREGVSAVLELTDAQAALTLPIFLAAAAGIALGGLLVPPGREAQPHGAGRRHPPGPDLPRSEQHVRVPLPVLGGAAAMPLLMLVAGAGASPLWSRPDYLIGASGGVFSLGKNLAPVGVLAATVLTTGTLHRHGRNLGAALLVAYSLVLFALGTRLLALIPVLVAASWLITRTDRRSSRTIGVICAAAVASFVLLSLPLALRQLPTHGLAPYAAALVTDPGFVAGETLRTALSNILFGFPLTYAVAYTGTGLSPSTLEVAVNPLPGNLTTWYEIAPYLRLNVNTPYNAMGELGHFGLLVVLAFFIATGVLLAWLWRLRLMNPALATIARLMVVGTTLLICVTAIQYNLRSTSRLLYYVAAVGVSLLVTRVVLRTLSRSNHRPVPQHGPQALSADGVSLVS
jgi:hypothetical protein